jgi:hypothetical protein
MYKLRYLLLLLLGAVSLSDAKIVFTHRTNPYATHQPVLYEIANRTTGPIIEFGCGDGSTDMLHEICRENKRLLISIDDDFAWMSKFMKKYRGDGYLSDNSGWHKFFFVPGRTVKNNENPERWIRFLDNFELLRTTQFDLCFIDQNPWMGRFETIKRIKGKVKYVILHDCNYYPMNNIFGKTLKLAIHGDPGAFDFSDIFTYFKVYFPLTPWPGTYGPGTLLASDTESNFPDVDYRKY